jgi:ubiquinone/menaquinone biosynthesis C-methylase UbiE
LTFLNRLLSLFFRILYTRFAWAYDLVSTIVSMGKWKSWVRCALYFTVGNRIMEIGHGPGHLLAALSLAGNNVFGMDASFEMGQLARRRLRRLDKAVNLARGRAQHLPFAKMSLTTILSTFPTAYIFQDQALQEFFRLLAPGGRLVVVLSAWITERHLVGIFLNWIYQVTGQAMPEQFDEKSLLAPFNKVGFISRLHWMTLKGSRVLLLIADKPKLPLP